jgi:hypothetical protein
MGSRPALLALTLACSVGVASCASSAERALSTGLTDDDFWKLSTSLSEPSGVFRHSDNLVSNEAFYAHTVRLLRPRGGVYIGVGPEQNFSYIARIQPALAFIVDIRGENRNLHLLYKALFEASADRADFLSRLFSRERPGGLGPASSVQELFTAYETAPPSGSLYEANLRLVRSRLLETHRLPLPPDDLQSIEYAFNAFYSDGPSIHYARTTPRNAPGPSYRSLMMSRDVNGQNRSYLASEKAFGFVKDLQARNLIVPVVGDFGGPHALRAVGDYIRQHGSFVSGFYGSNVEVYLSRQQMAAFCENLADLPHDAFTWFIGSKGRQPLRTKLKNCPPGAR